MTQPNTLIFDGSPSEVGNVHMGIYNVANVRPHRHVVPEGWTRE